MTEGNISPRKIRGWLLVYLILIILASLVAILEAVQFFRLDLDSSMLNTTFFGILSGIYTGILFPLLLLFCTVVIFMRKSIAIISNKILIYIWLFFHTMYSTLTIVRTYSVGGTITDLFIINNGNFIASPFYSSTLYFILQPAIVIAFLVYFFKSERVKNTLVN